MDNDQTVVCGSSLRAVSVATTLARARPLAATLGVSRVTDITRLDRIGIPVFTSIRPGAKRGSLCVNAGKGLTPEEARIGAYMEAIEFALSEPGASPVVQTQMATAREVLDGASRPDAILDFCPLLGAEIALDAPLACVQATEILSESECLVPADLVFLPSARTPGQPRYFDANSNGLASGNTLLEATVHGLAEVIERDITAFQFVRDTSVLVTEESLPPVAQALRTAITDAGLHLYVRFQPNAFGVAQIFAVIADLDHPSPYFINGGYGCHPHRSIALVRAICEAVQSRLSFIHGGRDDLVSYYNRFAHQDEHARTDYVTRLLASASNPIGAIAYNAVPDDSQEATDLNACFALLAARLERQGITQICRVAFTHPDDDLQVVKVIVPQLEQFSETSRRVGRRLRDYAEHA